jgi:hypothetical protein
MIVSGPSEVQDQLSHGLISPPYERLSRRRQTHTQRGRCLASGVAVVVAGWVCALWAPGALAAIGSIHAGTASTSNPAKQPKRKPHSVDPLTTPAMRAYIGSRTGDIAVGVKNMLTGRTYLWNGRSHQVTASIVKLDILETLLRQLHGGPIPGTEVSNAVGMIEDSDNDDATTLWDQDGGAPAVAAYDRLVGMDQTTPDVDWGLTTTSVGDQLTLLDELVETHALIDRGAQRFALELMENVKPSQAWGVSGGVPAGRGHCAQERLASVWERLAHQQRRADPGRRAVVSDRRPDEH